jgi:hypothetical protein
MVLTITINGNTFLPGGLVDLDNLLQKGPIPQSIKASDGVKYVEFTLSDQAGRKFMVTGGNVPIYPGALARQNAMSGGVVSKVIDEIKRRFGLSGGRRRSRRVKRRVRRTRK